MKRFALLIASVLVLSGARDFSRKIENLKIGTPKIQGNRAAVRVTYDSRGFENNFINYTLIKEAGKWKIDDIAIGGDEQREIETVFESYPSLKAELKKAIALEQKEQQERVRKKR